MRGEDASRGRWEAEDGVGADSDTGLSLRVEADWGERSSCNRWLHPLYPLLTPDYRLGSLGCLQFVVLHRVNFTVERITNVCIGQTSALQ